MAQKKSTLLRTCEIKKYGSTHASCELHQTTKGYLVKIIEDPWDLFVDFDIDLDSDETAEVAIDDFEKACLDRYTCDGDFTDEDIMESAGEEIEFY
jgi:hypothetical protein